MTTSGSLDANILLRLILDDVPPQHAAAMKLLADDGRFAGLLQQPQIIGNNDVLATAFELYCSRPKVSFEDCYLVSQAEANGAE